MMPEDEMLKKVLLEKVLFHVIVPLSYDRKDFQKACCMRGKKSITKKELDSLDGALKGTNSEAYFRYCFASKPFDKMDQMQGSPLQKDGENAFSERFELSQVQRTYIEIHKFF